MVVSFAALSAVIGYIFTFLFVSLFFWGIERAVDALNPSNESILAPWRRFTRLRFSPRRFDARRFTITALAILPYFFIPIGSLVPMLDMPFGIFAVSSLFALSVLLYYKSFDDGEKELFLGRRKPFLETLLFITAFWIVTALFVLFCARLGIDGDMTRVLAYASEPIWNASATAGRVAFLVLCASVAALAPRFVVIRRNGERVGETTVALCAAFPAALMTSVFLPMNVAETLDLTGSPAIALDFVFFWVKALFIQITVISLVKIAVVSLCKNMSRLRRRLAPFAMLFFGALLLLAAMYFS